MTNTDSKLTIFLIEGFYGIIGVFVLFYNVANNLFTRLRLGSNKIHVTKKIEFPITLTNKRDSACVYASNYTVDMESTTKFQIMI